jgi:hypothetical protein
LARIQPGTKYRVPQDFGIGPKALTERGFGYVPTGSTLEVTHVGHIVDFKWTGYPGTKLPQGPDSLVRSSFETMVETFSFREYV